MCVRLARLLRLRVSFPFFSFFWFLEHKLTEKGSVNFRDGFSQFSTRRLLFLFWSAIGHH